MDNIPVTLTANEWNVVLNALCQRPFAEVNFLIYKIKNQADAQAEINNIGNNSDISQNT
jgi:hypothetical protein